MYSEELPPPDFRATLSDGELMLQAWHPGLVPDWGAVASLARTPESPPIADLSILRDSEGGKQLIVTGIVNGETPAFIDAVCSWAASLGYDRVWLADRLVTLASFTLARPSSCAEASPSDLARRLAAVLAGVHPWRLLPALLHVLRGDPAAVVGRE